MKEQPFSWNGPLCSTCGGNGAIIQGHGLERRAILCPSCNGHRLGKIEGSRVYVGLSDHSEPIGSRK